MDIFDRLGNLIRSMLQDEDDDRYREASTGQPRFADPDLGEAWDELNEYMNAETDEDQTRPSRGPSWERTTVRRTPDSLRPDFRNLEVEFGAPMDEVRRAYKRLMATYHPDRHAANPENLRAATEIAKKINQSFQRIRSHYSEEA